MQEASTGRGWAAACHLAALISLVGVPFGHIIGPLVVWLIKKEEYPFVDDQGKEALNFQISLTIYGLVALVLIGVLFVAMLIAGMAESPATGGLVVFTALLIGLVILVAIAELILVIVAAIQASDGKAFRYPLTLRLLR